MSVQFWAFDVLTRRFAGTFDFINWKYGEKQESFSGLTADVKPSTKVRAALVPDDSGIAVIDDGVVVWAGILRKRKWKRRQSVVQLSYDEMSSFFYGRVRAPGLKDYIRTDTEQTTIWTDLVTNALSGAPNTGIPAFGWSIIAPTGNKHTLTFRTLSNYGAVFDNLQRRIRNLDWWVSYARTTDRRFIEFTFNVGHRGVNPKQPIVARYDDTPEAQGGNLLDHDFDEDSVARYSGVYTFGDGQPPTVPFGYDEDPLLRVNRKVRREIALNRSGTTVVSTLTARAREERRYRDQISQTMPLLLPADDPDYRSYTVGDRARIQIRDEWLQVYFPAALITEREISGRGSEAETVALSVDISNYEQPRDDEQLEVTG